MWRFELAEMKTQGSIGPKFGIEKMRWLNNSHFNDILYMVCVTRRWFEISNEVVHKEWLMLAKYDHFDQI